jgi:hypothetical protein
MNLCFAIRAAELIHLTNLAISSPLRLVQHWEDGHHSLKGHMLMYSPSEILVFSSPTKESVADQYDLISISVDSFDHYLEERR